MTTPKRFDSTYEGLKRGTGGRDELGRDRFDSTYEGLKHKTSLVPVQPDVMFRQYL